MRFLRSIRTYILAAFLFAVPATSLAGVVISVNLAPPVLPVYTQPVCPGDGYIWTPGYWAYGPDGYYWVPGTWAVPPQVGLLWTPGYWGFEGAAYIWHGGYWGPHVGFYGGVNYGYGYGGLGYEGGHWDHNRFFYNTAVSHVNVTVVHNVYHTTIVNRTVVNRVSYNGGPHGVNVRPNADQQRFDHEQHFQRTSVQEQHEHYAASNRQNFASQNHGRPPAPVASHNMPRPNNQPRTPMVNNQMHNNNVPRPSNSGFHGEVHNQPMHNAPAHNEPPHAAPHNEAHNPPPAHGNGGHGGGEGHGGDHHDHH